MIATAAAVAFVVFSCKENLSVAESLDLSETPVQTVDSMYFINTEGGKLKMRVEAQVMERYDNDTCSFELFPKGISVYAYTDDEVLETMLFSDNAKHHKSKKNDKELWSAFGNVVVQNVIRRQTMETDTLYWDQTKKEIYTDCYIRIFSEQGFMQGFGMRSDERARNASLLRAFNSYGVVVEDSTRVVIDSVNFIGPLLKK